MKILKTISLLTCALVLSTNAQAIFGSSHFEKIKKEMAQYAKENNIDWMKKLRDQAAVDKKLTTSQKQTIQALYYQLKPIDREKLRQEASDRAKSDRELRDIKEKIKKVFI